MRERGVEPPEKFAEPEVGRDTEFFLQSCIHLLSCRDVGMDIGPVPWTAVYQYCQAVGYDDWERMFNIVNLVDAEQRKKSEVH